MATKRDNEVRKKKTAKHHEMMISRMRLDGSIYNNDDDENIAAST
jgi:hypothetical protein